MGHSARWWLVITGRPTLAAQQGPQRAGKLRIQQHVLDEPLLEQDRAGLVRSADALQLVERQSRRHHDRVERGFAVQIVATLLVNLIRHDAFEQKVPVATKVEHLAVGERGGAVERSGFAVVLDAGWHGRRYPRLPRPPILCGRADGRSLAPSGLGSSSAAATGRVVGRCQPRRHSARRAVSAMAPRMVEAAARQGHGSRFWRAPGSTCRKEFASNPDFPGRARIPQPSDRGGSLSGSSRLAPHARQSCNPSCRVPHTRWPG